MKPLLTYYGGKQQLAGRIVGMMPEHRVYVEPFFGGGAVFFRKDPSPVEVINDTNSELVNFYETVKRDFTSLEKEVMITLHSRDLHRKAKVIYENPDMFDGLKRAWAVWVMANESYGSKIDATFGYDRNGSTSQAIRRKRESFTYEYAVRLQDVQIECADAVRVIKSRDTAETFFYCDPPYVGTDMGHYDGYSQEDFDRLIETLEGIDGRFLLSSFRNPALSEAIERHGWWSREYRMSKAMSKARNPKIEVLTANYAVEE